MLLLFFIFDPLGNIPIFANALKTVNPQRRWKIIVREHIIGLSILLLFMFAGQTFLSSSNEKHRPLGRCDSQYKERLIIN
jgi:multiple antibiotic resistance protein